MGMTELVRQARSFRRFDGSKPITADVLRSLVDLARLTPCGGNQQPLRYRLVSVPDECASVFPHLAWAGALKDWPGPAPGERPTGYIVIVSAQDSSTDVGIAAQTIQLAATEKGYGACMIGSIKRDNVKRTLAIPDPLAVRLVIALGIPAETVVLEEISPDDCLDYYRTRDDVHHVPKLRLEDVLIL